MVRSVFIHDKTLSFLGSEVGGLWHPECGSGHADSG